jgi:hypothetical protein
MDLPDRHGTVHKQIDSQTGAWDTRVQAQRMATPARRVGPWNPDEVPVRQDDVAPTPSHHPPLAGHIKDQHHLFPVAMLDKRGLRKDQPL